jgi:hypothetical protein
MKYCTAGRVSPRVAQIRVCTLNHDAVAQPYAAAYGCRYETVPPLLPPGKVSFALRRRYFANGPRLAERRHNLSEIATHFFKVLCARILIWRLLSRPLRLRRFHPPGQIVSKARKRALQGLAALADRLALG